jgi:hypothetical protein
MDWLVYEQRLSPLERASIQAAPVVNRPLADEPFTYFSAELLVARWKAHAHLSFIAESLAKGHLDLETTNIRFAQCLSLACFELRLGFITSWPAFALLFHKLFGEAVGPWLPSLFLAAVGQANMPRPQFDFDEVLAWHKSCSNSFTCHRMAFF